MKVWGWILVIFVSFSVLGSIIGGSSPAGVFFIVFGAYLLHRAKQKEIERKEKEEWSKTKE